MDLWNRCRNGYDQVGYLLLKATFDAISRIPERHAESIACAISRLWFALDKTNRNITLDNLYIAFGDEKSDAEIRKIAKQAFYNTCNMLFESARSLQWDTAEIMKYMRIEGQAHLHAAHEKGKGVLLLTGHVGNWELAVFIADLVPYEITGVYKKVKVPAAERFVLESRTRRGGRMYAVKAAIEGILTELSQGNFITLLVDHNAKRRHVFVDFFGKTAATEKGLAQLALTTGAPVVPYFIIRKKRHFVVEVLPEVPLIHTGDMEADITANTAEYMKIIENIIRKYPDQWLWMHRRWKTRPKVHADTEMG